MNNYADNNIYEQTKVPAAEIKSTDKANKMYVTTFLHFKKA
jgi:hypothetical protein